MTTASRSHWSLPAYAITILLSSFLIFQVQPLISKYILPWYGGTPAVWTTCMLFFQVLLFAGYAYAHLSSACLKPTQQCLLHAGLMLAALLLLPITPDAGWKPQGAEDPTLQILGLLTVSVGLPYFILSSTGPLLQGWFSRTNAGTSPYRLYALSNIGSVAGLVTYPFVVEPWLPVMNQAALWSAGFALFALFCMVLAAQMWRVGETNVALADGDGARELTAEAPEAGNKFLWFALSACASIMLLATTNQVCLDVAVIPFLWVLPLTLYLTSFILCFDHERWYPRRTYAVALGLSMVSLCVMLYIGQDAPILTQIVVHFAALFFCCMVCHGELVRLKPAPRYLTSFYLCSSAGGAMGGVLVGLVAPLVFHRYIELHLGMLGCCLVTLVVFFRDKDWGLYHGKPRWAWVCLIVAFFGLARVLRAHAGEVLQGELDVSRNFYGVLRIALEKPADAPDNARAMVHGRILHGRQLLTPGLEQVPTTYYGEQSAIGLVLEHMRADAPRRVATVGLGVGTLATYGRAGDEYRFYEINPEVIRLAEKHFTYLENCAARVHMVLGDARLSLEREAGQRLDVLVLDAFSSDAIPAHLLTREALVIYAKHLRPDGVLAIHISNRHFDLEPVVNALAQDGGFQTARIVSEGNAERGQVKADWMLLSRSETVFAMPEIRAAIEATEQQQRERGVASRREVPVWTDQFNTIVQILK